MAALCLGLASGLHANYGSARYGALKVQGNKILNSATGCPVFLKGVNIPSMEWQNQGEGPTGTTNGVLSTAQNAVNNWGANIIRVPLNQDRWLGSTACSGLNQAAYQKLVDDVVTWCAANNAYVILDLHWSDKNQGGSQCASGQNSMPDNGGVTFWTSVATKYANNPAVLFDLFNEPEGFTSWSLWKNGGTTPEGYTTPGMQKLVNTVRDTGAKNLIVAGGLNWAFDLSGIASNSLTDANTAATLTGNGIVYATHIYPWKSSPGACAPSNSCVTGALPASVTSNYAVMVTEFGQDANNSMQQPLTGISAGTWSQSVIDWAIANANGYVAWSSSIDACPCLITNWNYTSLSSDFGATVVPDLQSANPVLAACGGGSPTPSRTSTPLASTATRTGTPSSTATATSTATPTATRSSTASPTSTGTSTATRTSTPTGTVVPPSATPTATATSTSVPPTASPSDTRTSTPSSTSVPPSATATVTATRSPTPLVSATPTITGPIPSASSTPTVTLSATVQPATATSTDTVVVPTATFSSVPTATTVPTLVPTATSIPATATTLPTLVPTATSIPATATTLPTLVPTATAVPPTATTLPTQAPTGTAVVNTPTAISTPYAQAPVLISVSPGQAAAGDTITLQGTGFYAGATVSVDGVQLLNVQVTATTIMGTLPPHATGTVNVVVTNLDGQFSQAKPLDYIAGLHPVPPGPLKILAVYPVPQPNPKGLAVQLSAPADRLVIKVWTTALQAVGSCSSNGASMGWQTVPFPAGFLSPLANGTYYVTVEADLGPAKAQGGRPTRLVLIR